ncbi:uncharacterized protein LOC125313675 [Rhodamnia argentea]|uniref:Uncharacterized protein LOC125313675 n=1 Tax=Rhodamnia argentea TaxID=178133 RepID=A0ABM3GYL8_9MYRT|nr:uncharacterized protein LOC125313675 [Rhodamnia argentea]
MVAVAVASVSASTTDTYVSTPSTAHKASSSMVATAISICHHLLQHLHHPHLLRRHLLHHPHLLHPRHLHHLGTLLLLLPRHLHRLIGLPCRRLRLIGLHHHHPPGSDLLLLLGVETTRECTCFITRKDMDTINIKNKGTLKVPGERIAPNKTLSKIKKKTSIVIT